jgi:hypothetical protein
MHCLDAVGSIVEPLDVQLGEDKVAKLEKGDGAVFALVSCVEDVAGLGGGEPRQAQALCEDSELKVVEAVVPARVGLVRKRERWWEVRSTEKVVREGRSGCKGR